MQGSSTGIVTFSFASSNAKQTKTTKTQDPFTARPGDISDDFSYGIL